MHYFIYLSLQIFGINDKICLIIDQVDENKSSISCMMNRYYQLTAIMFTK